jgi:hypothetical protein
MKVWMRMGMSVEIEEQLIKDMQQGIYDSKVLAKAVIEAIKNGKVWTDGDTYIWDDDHHIEDINVNIPSIQIQACESFFYNPKDINFKNKE